MSAIVRDLPAADLAYEVAPPEYEYPFLKYGDSTAFVLTRFYKQTIAGWNADRLAGRFIPGLATDTGHPEAYLMEESKPTRSQSGMVQFTRTFARLPEEQVYFSSASINKPAFPTNDYSGAYVDSTSVTAIANVWSAAVTSDSISSRVVTGGTFTVTYKTSTTAALNYNDDAATIAAAINALADLVTDATTVSCVQQLTTAGMNRLQVNRATGSANFIGALSWTPSFTPANVVAESITSAQANFYAAPDALTITEVGHGLTSGDAVRGYSTTPSGGGTLATVTVTGADTFTIPVASALSVPNPVYYRFMLRSYTPGTDRVATRITEAYYLPAVTPGIASPTDIPMPDVAINDAQLLAIVIANQTGWRDYDAEPLARWRDWPIYMSKRIEINADNL